MYSTPRLYLGNKEILDFESVNYKNGGKSQVTSLSIKINDPELDGAALLGKEVVFFLNYGAEDTVPFFRGNVRQYKPSDKNLTLEVHDVLSFLAGTESPPLNITDDNNYDGFTLAQMIQDYIETTVNTSKTVIGLDMLNESNPPVSMTGFRNKSITPLKAIQSLLKTKSKVSTNTQKDDVKSNRLIVRDDGNKSNICFVEEQDIDSSGIRFSFNDGIEKLSFKKRPEPNYYATEVEGSRMTYQHNSFPTGIKTGKLDGKFAYPDEARQEAYLQANLNEDKKEISITTNKGHYLEIGNLVELYTPEHPELIGKHRIVSKSVSVGKSKINCKLKLNKEPPAVSDYL